MGMTFKEFAGNVPLVIEASQAGSPDMSCFMEAAGLGKTVNNGADASSGAAWTAPSGP